LAALLRLEPALAAHPDYWAERGWVELRADPARAAASFDRALALAPTDLRALNGAASAAEAQGQNEKALSLLLRAKKAYPNDLRTLLHFGTLCLRGDLSVDALDAFQHAHKLAPSNDLALFMLARAQIAFEQWEKSHALFTEFHRRVPGYTPTQYALGWLDIRLNRLREAREHLARSLALDATQTGARYELGQLDLDEGRFSEVEHELKTVLQRDPQHAKANIAMGDLLLHQGNLAGAREHYEAAIAADPQSGPAHYKLSRVLSRLNDPGRAAKERDLGVSLNAKSEKARKTVLVLAEPDGRLLTGEPGPAGGR
jgi:tetratricopeptide (TPR) repeat protein